MSVEDVQDFEDFDELERHYKTTLSLSIENIYDKILKIAKSKKQDKERLSGVKNDIQKLAGPTGNFGFFQISNILKNLSTYLSKFTVENKKYKKKEKPDFEYIVNTLSEIKKILFSHESNKENRLDNTPTVISSSSMWFLKKIPENWNRKIVICDYDNRKYLTDLRDKLAYFGYCIDFFKEIEEAKNKILKEDIHLIMLDTALVMENKKIVPWLRKIKEKRHSFKIFFISSTNDFKTRLFAIKNGGDAFFESSTDVARVANKIEYFADNRRTQPDHILIVDDDINTLSYYAELFQQRGMVTSVTTDPFYVFNLIAESTPDLILIDMLMPGCNGIELTAMIRQHDEFLPIPIIIYSVFEKPMSVDFEISFSGYEFISKFTDDETFVSTAINRIDRSRNLRYFMERDSLTSLLNHSNICDSFQREFIRAQRTNLPLSYAIIDIDNFKSVNDVYGHFVGDTVLKSLAYMLIERLRTTDIIGRYGGEEFVVIMSNTSVQSAKKVIDVIRRNFSKIAHNAFGRDFNVTFSCGVAGYPEFPSTKIIFDNADKALYIAKKDGKNKVVIYQGE
ncbi:MAG: diguanylate cyclase [Spirochaetaceae bacterium]|nr:diguanylate cyclase [Spirochaetaceae bacterium]